MNFRLLRVTLVVLTALAFSTLPVHAQGRGHAARDNDRGRLLAQDHDERRDGDRDRDDHRFRPRHHKVKFADRDDQGFRRDRDDRGFRRDGDRDRDDRFGRPPGWSHGRKTGWGDRDVPPGQAKKEGFRSPFFRHHRHHHRRHHRRFDDDRG